MQLKHWGVRLLLGAVLFGGALGCQITDRLVAQLQPTPTFTRTPRPTFTPVPSPTFTPIPPSPTIPPPTATRTATARPAPTRTPTRPPAPTAVPQPTVPPPPQFEYAATNISCTHAGNQYIKGRVYASQNPDAGGVAGIRVGLGDATGTNAWVTIRSEDDGFYTFTLSTPGQPANAGTYYVWLMDGTGKRISDIGGPIRMNPVGPDAPGTCWAGVVDFYHR